MSKLHVNHIRTTIEKSFKGKIDTSDLLTRPQEEIDKAILTRGLAAYCLYVLAATDIDNAVKSIVDGYNDNGIDAILFDRNPKILWLVQSKWIESGNGEPETGEVKKFTSGVLDLLDLKLDRFNSRVNAKETELTEALDDPSVRINIVIAYTGQNCSEHNLRAIQDLLKELNDPSELARFYSFTLKDAHKALTGSIVGNPITIEIALSNWGPIEGPYQAFYGLINASDIAPWWTEHRARLFSDNIRNFIGLTEINESILGTLSNEPENFWYFNNGITALCRNISKKPLGGGDRNMGYFVCEGVSIVNGAQTVGCIGHALERSPDKFKVAKVLIRLISLKDCPTDFGVRITKATNTQNKIEKRDFVSLDPEQERLRTELLLEGKTYHFIRTDENILPDDANYLLEEATVALACSNEDYSLSIQAKREIGKLWEDITKKPYTDIFNADVTATELWRSIEVFRAVNTKLKSMEKATRQGRERSFYIHANRFLLHLVFQKIPKNATRDPNYGFETFVKDALPHVIQELIEPCRLKVEEMYPTSLIHQIFRNFTKCKTLKDSIFPTRAEL
jgi:hypothetical protein